MTSRERLQASLSNGLAFLARQQFPGGGFPLQFTMHYDGDKVLEDLALFPVTQILLCLHELKTPQAAQIIQCGVRALLSEMTGPGLWRFYNKAATRNGVSLHSFAPADLDDMACASLILKREGIAFPDNARLMLMNRNGRGRFYTWLLPRPVFSLSWSYWGPLLRELNVLRGLVFWRLSQAGYLDVDGVVNANVLFYLGQSKKTEPIIEWLPEIVRANTEAVCDKWYRDIFTFYYAYSRNYRAGVASLGEVIPLILERISQHATPSGRIGENALQTAMAVCTLLDFGHASECLEPAVNYLVASQSLEGNWPSAPAYYGGPNQNVSFGCPEVTTAFCLEALSRYKDFSTR